MNFRIPGLLVSIPIVWLLFNCCKKEDSSGAGNLLFEAVPEKILITPDILQEASGIADSKNNPGFLWVQEDGNNPTELTLVGHNGVIKKKILLKDATNRDWEDLSIAAGPVPGKNYIYLADIGDNTQQFVNYTIYRFEEPGTQVDTIASFDKILFSYPDKPHDAEAILIDPRSKDIYLVTKRDIQSLVFKIPYPQNDSTENKALLVGKLSYNGVVSAAFTNDGLGIAIKTYEKIHFYSRENSESIEDALQHAPILLPYILEPLGEAICFRHDGSGYYTLSERNNTPVSLNFYKRK